VSTVSIFTPTEIIALIASSVWVLLNYFSFRHMLSKEKPLISTMYSHNQIRLSILIFLVRFSVSFILLAETELFPVLQMSIYGYSFAISLSIIIVILIWIPEIITLILWGIIFAVFALAGLGAALFIDYLYFGNNLFLWGKVGPIGLLMIVLIVLSFRYFSNYSIGEIVKMAKRHTSLKIILLFSSISCILIGGGVLWRVFINSKIYRDYLSGFLDKVENATAAISVMIILLTLPLQFPSIPLPVRILILINAPIAFSAVMILLIEKRFGAWKTIFEIYTEEFAAQSTILKERISNPKIMLVALVGNWAAIPIALYDVGATVYWLLGDLLLTFGALIILGLRYISSMIQATKEIVKEMKQTK